MIAIYLRLSKEDQTDGKPIMKSMSGKAETESSSIASQRTLIMNYLKHQPQLCQEEVVEFCDDGWSGTHQERPGLKKLLGAVRKGTISCVVVKDFSRFSRDYVELGAFLYRTGTTRLPRFISINDHYDSSSPSGQIPDLGILFQTLLYDLYSRDISLKVQAAMEHKKRQGLVVPARVPYGYRKQKWKEQNEQNEQKEQNEQSVRVEKKEAAVVRQIFAMAAEGMSYAQIAVCLREREKERAMDQRGEKITGKQWSGAAVGQIVHNRFYLGELSAGKTRREAVGSRHRVSVPQEQWNCRPDHHPALVTEELFAAAQPQEQEKRVPRSGIYPTSALTGLLYCGGCGRAFSFKPGYGKNHSRRFECTTPPDLRQVSCCFYVSEKKVSSLLNAILRLCLQTADTQASCFRDHEADRRKQMSRKRLYSRQLSVCLSDLQSARTACYEQLILGQLNVPDYTRLIQTCQWKQQILEQQKKEWEQKCLAVTDITPQMVQFFLKKVTVNHRKQVHFFWICEDICQQWNSSGVWFP